MYKSKPYDKDCGYSELTHNLIERMCKNVEREDFVLDKKTSEELILKTYDLFDLPRPKKVVWCKDIFENKFQDVARSAWSAGSAVDYDFGWFVIEHEYCINQDGGTPPNDNDKKYLEYSKLLMEAKETGLGYRVEYEDILYLVPTPLVLIDEQNRFHSETKPAIRWKGGAERYFLHGVSFEKEWWTKIVKGKLSAEEVFAIDNLEHRRIAYEYLDKSKMKALKDYR